MIKEVNKKETLGDLRMTAIIIIVFTILQIWAWQHDIFNVIRIIRHFGNCIGRVNGKWRNVYNVLGYPRVVLSLKDAGFYKESVFSTKNPEQMMKIINEKIKKI